MSRKSGLHRWNQSNRHLQANFSVFPSDCFTVLPLKDRF